MSTSEHFRYRNDVFQSDIFVSDIGITDVGYRISDIADIEIDVDAHLWFLVLVSGLPSFHYLFSIVLISVNRSFFRWYR